MPPTTKGASPAVSTATAAAAAVAVVPPGSSGEDSSGSLRILLDELDDEGLVEDGDDEDGCCRVIVGVAEAVRNHFMIEE